jgi:hypothetical protein
LTDIARADGIEAGSALEFQERWWRVERVAWVLTTLVLVVAAAGVFGRGPVARRTAGARGAGAWVEYERVVRFRTPTMLVVHLPAGPPPDGRTTLALRGSVLGKLSVQRVIPEPLASAAGPDGISYTIQRVAAATAAPGIADSATVRIVLEPGAAGPVQATVAVHGAPALSFRQFVVP